MILPLAVAMGDPAGVGPEITVKAWKARELHSLAPFFAVGDPRAIAAVSDAPVRQIGDPQETADVFPTALPVISVADAGDIVPGRPDIDGARCALDVAHGASKLGCEVADRGHRLTNRYIEASLRQPRR